MGLGFLKGIKRANSANLAGFVKGPITKMGAGKEMQVTIENGQLVCFCMGKDDIVIDKNDVQSVECVSQNIKRQYGNNIMVCNSYAVTFNNGEYGQFDIFVGKAVDFTMLLK